MHMDFFDLMRAFQGKQKRKTRKVWASLQRGWHAAPQSVPGTYPEKAVTRWTVPPSPLGLPPNLLPECLPEKRMQNSLTISLKTLIYQNQKREIQLLYMGCKVEWLIVSKTTQEPKSNTVITEGECYCVLDGTISLSLTLTVPRHNLPAHTSPGARHSHFRRVTVLAS